MSISTLLKRTFSVIQHISLMALSIFSTLPIFRWYFSLKSIPGSDFHNTGTYLQKLIQDTKFPAQKWLYHWFTGSPLTFNYPNLHLYAMLPLAKTFGVIQAQNFYAFGSLAVLIIFAYLLFWELSEDKVVSAFLAVALAYSASLYPSLIVIGSTTCFATQAFLPLALYLLEKWRKGKDAKFFYLSALSTGLSMYGHATLGLVFILPASLLVIYFSLEEGKIKKSLLYLVVSVLIGSAGALHYIWTTISRIIPTSGPRGMFGFIDWANKEVFWKDFFGVSSVLVIATLTLLGTTLVIKRHKKKVAIRPYIAAFLYLAAYNILLYLRLNPLSGVLNWSRSLWAFPVIIGAISASLYRSLDLLHDRLYKRIILYGALLLVFLLPRTTSLEPIKNRAGGGYAHPRIVTQNLSGEGLTALKEELTPHWLDANSKQERLYSLDDRFNMWWNSFFDLPLVRGYFPGLSTPQRESFLNQMDISIMDSVMVNELGTSVERAENAAYFFIDWYSIKYVASSGRFRISPYLESETIIEEKQNIYGVDYLELSDGLYSPILAPTDSPTLCILGSDNAYNYFLRGLARFNLNSKILIPINGPMYVEGLKKSFLEACDALVLYDFRTRGVISNPIARRRGWKALEGAVRSGKPMYIETGESKSAGAGSGSLPKFFPVSHTQLESMGEAWEFKTTETTKDTLLSGLDVNLFSPPVWEDYPWKLSSSAPKNVKDWAGSVLEHKGHPLLVSGTFGDGRVIWSGLNLPFHMDYYDNEEEGKLFLNIVSEIVGLPQDDHATQTLTFNTNWLSPEKRVLTTSTAKGVLFRERSEAGWRAEADTGKKLEIYTAGPNHPGFMYVRLPADLENGSVTFSYSGSPLAWLYYGIAFTSIGIVVDEAALGGKIVSKRAGRKLNAFLGKRLRTVKGWWDKEEE